MAIYPAETIFPSGSLYPEKIGTGFDFPFGNIYNRITSGEKQSITNSVNKNRFRSSENKDSFATSAKQGLTSSK